MKKPKRIAQGRYVAEILESRNTADTETFWHYVLHRDGLSDVIAVKRFSTYEEAVEGAKTMLMHLNRAASPAE